MPKRILIIEANTLLIEVMSYILINNGYEVYAATNGSEVFNHIKRNRPDLIILDAVLPGINGTEICQLIKLNQTTRSLPIIMCSEDEISPGFAEHHGAPDAILHKPFDINSLVEKVKVHLAA